MKFVGMMTLLPLALWSAAFAQTPPQRDPQGYEFVLFPIVAPVPVPGAWGSLWMTELSGYNGSDEPVQIFQSFQNFFCEDVFFECRPGSPIPPRTEFSAKDDLIVHPQEPAPLGFVYVQGRLASRVFFNLRVTDLSRRLTSGGTELPAVRETEFHTARIILPGIPVREQDRAMLRIYTPPRSNSAVVLVRLFASGEPSPRISHFLELANPETRGFVGYAQLRFDDHPAIFEAESVRVEVEPLTQGLRIWAFVSVTNNETQQVLTITPQ